MESIVAAAGAVVGALGGAMAGWAAAFFRAYFLHPLARVMNHQGRILIGSVYAPTGSMAGSIAGLILGAVTGGFGSLAIGLIAAVTLGSGAFVMLRRVSGEAQPWAAALIAGILGGAVSGAFVGYGGALLLAK